MKTEAREGHPTQVLAAHEWWSWDLNPGSLTSEAAGSDLLGLPFLVQAGTLLVPVLTNCSVSWGCSLDSSEPLSSPQHKGLG